jgi:hypothetical protein
MMSQYLNEKAQVVIAICFAAVRITLLAYNGQLFPRRTNRIA